MKMKKMLSLLTATAMAASCFAGFVTSASAATADDIVPIDKSGTYWFDDYMSAGLSAGDLIADSHFYTPTGNSYNAGKGSNTDSGASHLNCLRLKNVQDMLQFSVSKPSEITVYTQSHSRGVVATTTVPTTSYKTYDEAVANSTDLIAVQPNSTTAWTFTVDKATDICFSNYGGDFFIAGVGVKTLTTDPEISVSPASATINLGDTTTLAAATQNTGDAAVVWSSDNEAVATVADGVVTTVAPGTANITATVTVNGVDYTATCALTVQDVATVTYDISAYACEGTAPEAVTVTKGSSVTIPVNNSLYFNGMTLKGWTDGVNTYAIGESVTLTADKTLTPVFEDNTATLGDAETSVTYYFGESNGAATIAVQGANNPSAIIVEQAVIGDKTIDVKLDIDASAGKFNNFKRGDTWAQVNGGTIIKVPVIAGSVVTMGNIYNDAGTYTIGGTECTGDGGTYTATEAGTVEIVAGTESGGYWESITVTYPKVEAVVTPAPVVVWTESGSTKVTEADGVYTVTQPTNEAAAPVSVDLLSIMKDAPADLTAADGVITVSYDLYRPSENKGSSNWFIDISTNTNMTGWSGGNTGAFGRLSGYGPWGNNFKFVPGSGSTAGTTYQFSSAKDDEWTTVVYTIDLNAKTVKAAMGEDSSEAMGDSYPTAIENALYLNVEPCDQAPGNDTVLQFKNITATYTAPDPNATPTPSPEPTEVPVPPVIPENVTLHKYPANNEYVTNGNQCNTSYKLTFVDGADETVKAYFADPTNGAAVDTELVKNYKNYISGTSTSGTHPSIKATLGAGTHTIYYLGYNHGNNVTATINGTTYTAGAGVNLMGDGGNILKVYAIEITLTEAVTDAEIVFDSTDQWLPDMYAIVIAETAAAEVEKTMPTVTVEEYGTYTDDVNSKPAKAFTGTFTVDAEKNYAVEGVVWTVGDKTAESNFETTISGGTVVTGLVVVADDLAAIPMPTATTIGNG